MHDVENEVRELLRARSGDVGFDPRIPGPVVRRSRRRRAATTGAAGLGAVALALVLVGGLRALTASDGTRPGTDPSPTGPPKTGEVPSTFVGFTDRAVVRVSTRTGKTLSTIAGPDVVGELSGGADVFSRTLAIAPDRTAVYFSVPEASGAGRRLVLVPIEGGEPQDLGPGTEPVPSPDGARLAYLTCTPERCGRALVIRDLTTGEETTVPAHPTDSDVGGSPASWLPDGRLIVNLVYPGDSPGSVRLVDPDRPAASLLDAPEVEPLAPDLTGWWAVGYDAESGGVLVRETCCGLVGTDSRIVSVDPDSGQDLGTIVPGGWFVVEPDASGRHLLLMDDRGAVYVARDGDAPQLVAEGFRDIDW